MKWTMVAAAALTIWTTGATGLDKIRFATNWLAEAEHGGFYQALADGTYAAAGLDVAILPGGPLTANRLLLAAGRVEFSMGANMLSAFDAAGVGAPSIVVASVFQKDPIVLIAHPGVGLDRFEDLPKASAAFIGKDTFVSVWRWLKNVYGFSDAIVKPYTFNAAPFLADRTSIQQGYVTSEPFAIAREGRFQPNVFLLADHGYASYSTTIEARADLVRSKPDLVQRFVDASMAGWCAYLYGDNRAANALIRRDNPDMTDAQIRYSVEKMKTYGIVDSGDALTLGLGAMTDERMAAFFAAMARAGVVATSFDYKKAYTLQFVNKGRACAGRSQ